MSRTVQQPMSTEAAETLPPVRFDHLSVEFPSDAKGGAPNRVISDVSLTCEPGEFVVLIGPSGCGKTTALNVLAGLIEPSEGDVQVLGVTPREARSQLGYMLARDALLPWRTALGNVEFALEIRGVERSTRCTIAREYLELVGLDHAARRYPWQLSHGMRQRVALARTWATDPKLVLMDEPFSALDAQTRSSVREEFLRIWERERHSVVFVTHDLNEAILLGDRIVLLNHGEVQLDARVPFDRPRDALHLQELPEFHDFRRQLWELLGAAASSDEVGAPEALA
jgi:NitT/TauT family transport system ATP-binding protein